MKLPPKKKQKVNLKKKSVNRPHVIVDSLEKGVIIKKKYLSSINNEASK